MKNKTEQRELGGYRPKQIIAIPRLHRSGENAEHHLLGAMLLIGSSDWERLEKAVKIASVAAFHGELESIAFAVIAEHVRQRRSFDESLIYPAIVANYGQERGVVESILEWMASAYLTHHVVDYAEAVVAAYQERASIALVNDFAIAMQAGADVATERESLMEKLKAVADVNASSQVMESSIDKLFDEAVKQASDSSGIGIPTGIGPLDDLIKGGPKPGQLIFVVARPSHGKSVLGIQWALAAPVKRSLPSMIVSLEMLEAEVIGRLIRMAGVRLEDEVSVAMFRDLPIYVRYAAGWNIERIERETEAACKNNGIKLVVIDYLLLIAKHDARMLTRDHLVEVTRRLKQLAMKCRIPVIVLSQLNRKVESRDGHAIRLEDIAESDSVAQDADVIVGLWRDEVSRITVIKQRDGGQTGCVDVMLHPDKQLFVEAATDREMPTW
jgi:replicative DNA helicase